MPSQVFIGEIVPTPARAGDGGQGVAGQSHPLPDLFGELPEIGELLDLASGQVGAASEQATPAAVELGVVPAPKSPTENPFLRCDLTNGMVFIREAQQSGPQSRNRLRAGPDGRSCSLCHASGPRRGWSGRYPGCHGSSTTRFGKRARNDSASAQLEQTRSCVARIRGRSSVAMSCHSTNLRSRVIAPGFRSYQWISLIHPPQTAQVEFSYHLASRLLMRQPSGADSICAKHCWPQSSRSGQREQD